jgi:hypothetical protein
MSVIVFHMTSCKEPQQKHTEAPNDASNGAKRVGQSAANYDMYIGCIVPNFFNP